MSIKKFGRRSAVVSVLATAALILAGCGGSAQESSKKALEPKKDGEKITISYTHRLPDGPGMTSVSEIVDRWNKENPEIQVKATKYPGKATDLIKQLEKDVANNEAPCLAQVGYSEVAEVYTKGLLEDVTAEAEKYKDQFSAAYGLMAVGDKVVGLPQDTGPLVYYYDEAEFKALGLEVPKTLDDLRASAKKASASGKQIIVFQPDEAQNGLSAMAAAAGDPWYRTKDNKWVINVDSNGSKIVADFWQEMIDSGAAAVIPRWDDTFTKAITDKKVIATIGAAWEAGFILDGVVGADGESTWKVAQLPNFGTGKTGPDGGSGVAVLKGCKYPVEAMKFNNWFNNQVNDLASQGLVPAATAAAKTPDKIKKQFGGQDVFKVFSDANKSMVSEFSYIPGFSSVGEVMGKKAAEAAAGKAKIADIFKVAQEQSKKALHDLKLPVAD